MISQSSSRPRFQVHAGFNDSKELLSIPKRRRLEARGAWEAAGCWSCNKLTDGWVPAEALQELGITPAIIALLVESTLWIEVGDVLQIRSRGRAAVGQRSGSGRVPTRPRSGIQFDNWPKWQITKDEWERGLSNDRERSKRYRRRKKGIDDDGVTRDDGVIPETVANDDPDSVTRDASHRREEKSSYLSREVSAVGSGPPSNPLPDEFPDHCENHRHTPVPPACHACRRVRETNQRIERESADMATLQAVNGRQRELDRIAQCADCDIAGWRIDPITGDIAEPAKKCTHPEIPK